MDFDVVKVFSIQQFCDLNVSEQDTVEKLYYRIDKYHTFGDCQLSAISGQALLEHLTEIDSSFKNKWLEDHLSDMFELDLSV